MASASLGVPKAQGGRSRFSKALPAPPPGLTEAPPSWTPPSFDRPPPPPSKLSTPSAMASSSIASPTLAAPSIMSPSIMSPSSASFASKALDSPLPPLPLKGAPISPPPMSIPRRPVAQVPVAAPAAVPAPQPSPVQSISSLLSAYSHSSAGSAVRSSEGTASTKTSYIAGSPEHQDMLASVKKEDEATTESVLMSYENESWGQGPIQRKAVVQEDKPPVLPVRNEARPATPPGSEPVNGIAAGTPPSGMGNPSPSQAPQLWRRRSQKPDRSLAVSELKLVASHGSTASTTLLSQPLSQQQQPLPLAPPSLDVPQLEPFSLQIESGAGSQGPSFERLQASSPWRQSEELHLPSLKSSQQPNSSFLSDRQPGHPNASSHSFERQSEQSQQSSASPLVDQHTAPQLDSQPSVYQQQNQQHNPSLLLSETLQPPSLPSRPTEQASESPRLPAPSSLLFKPRSEQRLQSHLPKSPRPQHQQQPLPSPRPEKEPQQPQPQQPVATPSRLQLDSSPAPSSLLSPNPTSVGQTNTVTPTPERSPIGLPGRNIRPVAPREASTSVQDAQDPDMGKAASKMADKVEEKLDALRKEPPTKIVDVEYTGGEFKSLPALPPAPTPSETDRTRVSETTVPSTIVPEPVVSPLSAASLSPPLISPASTGDTSRAPIARKQLPGRSAQPAVSAESLKSGQEQAAITKAGVLNAGWPEAKPVPSPAVASPAVQSNRRTPSPSQSRQPPRPLKGAPSTIAEERELKQLQATKPWTPMPSATIINLDTNTTATSGPDDEPASGVPPFPLGPAPEVPEGHIWDAPKLRPDQLRCWVGHKAILPRPVPNLHYPLRCQTCGARDTLPRRKCGFCGLRVCEACLALLRENEMEVEKVLAVLENRG